MAASSSSRAEVDDGQKSTKRLEKLFEIETTAQAFWEKHRMFELDAPGADEEQQPKFMTTFPYPYLNGRLHLGHSFTLTKCEFAAGYQRLKGKRALFPFAFHGTGMPIAACADKLKLELSNNVAATLKELKARQPEFIERSQAALARLQAASKAVNELNAKNKNSKNKDLVHTLATAVSDIDNNLVKQANIKLEKVLSPQATGGILKNYAEKCESFAQAAEQHVVDCSEAVSNAPATAASSSSSSSSSSTEKKKEKEKAGRGKEKAKKEDVLYQWEIMQMLGLTDEEIPEFTDPAKFLKYFPPQATADLQRLGVKVDWRRAFHTTDNNPYYDSFIRWQFNTLHAQGDKLAFGKRYSIWAPSNNQPCMDHDRDSGEGVKPTEYTCVKLRVLPFEATAAAEAHPFLALLEKNVSVFLVAATMRPETMVGQTNVWVHPDIEYGIFATADEQQVFVMTDRSARNLSFQSHPEAGLVYTKEFGKTEKLGTVTGRQLIGLALSAPRSPYERIWVLPMMSVLADVGTGVVTSVPSDAPADYASWRELKRKPDFRALFGVQEAWLLEPVPILRIPELGDMCAIKVCEDMGIISANDPRLTDAKDLCYRRGFAQGEMIVGPYTGTAVSQSKDLARRDMIAAGEAFPYAEPSGVVISRSGDVCVVCLADQWYLRYGENEAWREQAREALAGMNTYGQEIRGMFEAALAWLNTWPLSRTYGMGTRIPWDEQFLIESLSDSTIYNAYYAVAAQLQGKSNLFGVTPGPLGLRAEQLTHAVWDYVLLGKDYPAAEPDVPAREALDVLRREFQYWFPTDLRISGKELIQNHLTFYLYNNTAIFPREQWPKGVKANGHLLLDNEKMSKSKGNFLTLTDGVKLFGADALRWTLATAGDGLEDANFETNAANKNIFRLFLLISWFEEVVKALDSLRTGELNFRDRVFEAQMDQLIADLDRAYEDTSFRAVSIALFDFISSRDTYRLSTANVGMHRDTLRRFLTVFPVLLSPICPHVSEYLWQIANGRGAVPLLELQPADSVLAQRWPEVRGEVDPAVLRLEQHVSAQRTEAQRLYEVASKAAVKAKKPNPANVKIFVALAFGGLQAQALNALREHTAQLGACPTCKEFTAALGKTHELVKNKKIMPFVNNAITEYAQRGADAFNLTLPFDELQVLTQNTFYLKPIDVSCTTLEVVDADAEPEHPKAQLAQPGKPSFFFQ